MNILQIFTRIPFNDNNNLSFEYLLAPPLNILKRFNPRMQIMRAAQKRQLHGNRQSCLVYPASLFIHRLFETIRPPPPFDQKLPWLDYRRVHLLDRACLSLVCVSNRSNRVYRPRIFSSNSNHAPQEKSGAIETFEDCRNNTWKVVSRGEIYI